MNIKLFSGMRNESQIVYNIFSGPLSYKSIARYKGAFSGKKKKKERKVFFIVDLISPRKILVALHVLSSEHGVLFPDTGILTLWS